MKTQNTINYTGPSLVQGEHKIKINSDRNGVRIELLRAVKGGLAGLIASQENDVLEMDWDAADKACDPRIEDATSEDSRFETIEEFAISWARNLLMKKLA